MGQLIYNIGGLLRDMHDASSIDVMAKLCRLQHYVLLERESTALARAGSNTSQYGRSLDPLAAVVALALIDVDNTAAMPLEARNGIFALLEVRQPALWLRIEECSCMSLCPHSVLCFCTRY